MRSVLQDQFDFLFISHTNNDLKDRSKEEVKRKDHSHDRDLNKVSFGKLLDAEIRSLA